MKTAICSLIFCLTILGVARSEEKPAHASSLELLLPAPQEMKAGTGSITLGPAIRLSVADCWKDDIGRYLWLLDEVLLSRKANPVTVVKDPSTAIRVVQKSDGTLPKNGYELNIGEGAIELTAADSAGVFNALATLAQLIESCGSQTIELPCCHIRDWPELTMRAVQIDMTCQQYTAAYVQKLMRTLARYKVNAVLMEYTAMFPFRSHKAISRPDAFSEADIQAIRRTAEECNQEIIPLMQCAGHLEYVLTQDPTGIRLSQGHDGYSYCLTKNKEQVLPFIESLIDEILAQHPGLKHLHIGGDEVTPGTWVNPDSCKECLKAGDFHKLYLKHYASITKYCLKQGVTPLMWTDVIAPFELRDKPEELAAKIREAAAVLPREVVGVDWWYRDNNFRASPLLRELGFEAITASAARSGTNERFDLPHFRLHMENIRAGCLQAVSSGMPGSLITSWSYRGVPHEICLPEYACAAYGWNPREVEVTVLMQRFFRQRYGLGETESATLVKSAFQATETGVRIPTIVMRRLGWDAAKRTWMLTAEMQTEQFLGITRNSDTKRLQASLNAYLRQSTSGNIAWQSARKSARRHENELQSWELSRRLREHRLKLLLALISMRAGEAEKDRFLALDEERNELRRQWMEFYRDIFTMAHMQVELDIRLDVEPTITEAVRREWAKPTEEKKAESPPSAAPAGKRVDRVPSAALIKRIVFDGFAANEVYPADINSDGRLELLCLQSPGCYQSDVFEGESYAASAEEQRVFCLTAIDLEGKVLWRLGEPYLKSRCPTSHVADQMLWCGLTSEKTKPEIAVIKRNILSILDAASGTVKRSADLGADNHVIVHGIRTRNGSRLLVQNTDKGYPPYVYGSPALLYDAADLRLLATISDAVGTGHSPRAIDIDGDGNDEILIGFDAYDAGGKRLWRMEGNHRRPTTTYHVDQLQVGKFDGLPTAAVVYAASGDVEMGTIEGKLLWKNDFGHAQHVVHGDFRSDNKNACIAIYGCRDKLGAAQKAFLERSGTPTPPQGNRNNIAFLNSKGKIVNLIFPPSLKFHSGEGILVYPQGCPDGSDALITRDWPWPEAFDLAGKNPFAFEQPKTEPATTAAQPAGPGPDGYGVRIADFDNDGGAEILIHDQTAAWIYKPPYPKEGAANTHKKLEPITGQGWYR